MPHMSAPVIGKLAVSQNRKHLLFTTRCPNEAFLRAMRYMFIFSFVLLSFVVLVLGFIRAEDRVELVNLLTALTFIAFVSLIISLIISYFGVKKAIAVGELEDKSVLLKNGKLNLNFFKTRYK